MNEYFAIEEHVCLLYLSLFLCRLLHQSSQSLVIDLVTPIQVQLPIHELATYLRKYGLHSSAMIAIVSLETNGQNLRLSTLKFEALKRRSLSLLVCIADLLVIFIFLHK